MAKIIKGIKYLVALLFQSIYGIVATSMKSSITTWPRAGPTGTQQEVDFCGIQQGSHCWITSGIKSIHIEQCIIWTQCILGNLQNTNNAKSDNFRSQGVFSPAPPGNGRTTCQFPVFSWFKGQWELASLHIRTHFQSTLKIWYFWSANACCLLWLGGWLPVLA